MARTRPRAHDRRLAAALLLLGAALSDARRREAALVGARADERRRLARDVHDTIAQDLAFVVMHTAERHDALDGELLAEVSAAAKRALNASRAAINGLSAATDEPLEAELATEIATVSRRTGIAVRLRVADVTVPADLRQAIVRIACEAVTNAARHGGASTVDIDVQADEALRVRIADDGQGLDASRRRPGHGLTGMFERARACGGWLLVEALASGGTVVEAVFPWTASSAF